MRGGHTSKRVAVATRCVPGWIRFRRNELPEHDTTADQDSIVALMELAADAANGKGRQMIVARLGRAAKSQAVVTLLIELLGCVRRVRAEPMGNVG
jgi:hypothetical protein